MNQLKNINNGHYYAFFAFFTWGLFPIFFSLLPSINPFTLTAFRTILTALYLFILIKIVLKAKIDIDTVKENISKLLTSTILIGINHITFIFLVYQKKTRYIALGYFLTPLFKSIIGVFFLKEELNKFRMLAIILMSLLMIFFFVSPEGFPLLAVLLGLSFALYGLSKKGINLPSTQSLLFEMSVLSIFYFFFLTYKINIDSFKSIIAPNNLENILLTLSGLVTLTPLFLYNQASKMIELHYLGQWQNLAPFMQTLCAIFFFEESFTNILFFTYIVVFILVLINILENFYKRKKHERK